MLMLSSKYVITPLILWLQKDNVSNQREHIVHLLANEQSRLGKLSGNEPVCAHYIFSSLFCFFNYESMQEATCEYICFFSFSYTLLPGPVK